jgi:heme-degrading monooxygenase HmoA
MTTENDHQKTLEPEFDLPYYAVIFTSIRSPEAGADYAQTAEEMMVLAKTQDGYLGMDSLFDSGMGIAISYWRDEASIAAWRAQADHEAARAAGRARWYQAYQLRVAKVERAYGWSR